MFRSIQWRITISFAVLVFIVMTILGIFLTSNIRDIQIDNLRKSLEDQALLVSEVVLPFMSSDPDVAYLKTLINKIGTPVDERITVINSSGKVVGDSEEDIAVMGNHAERPEFRSALSGEYGESMRYSITLGYDMMYVAVPVIDSEGIIGAVRVSLPMDDIEKMTGGVVAGVIAAIIIAVGLVVISAWFISRLITKPVRELTEASEKMASGELDQRISVGAMEETDKLARSFNMMSAKLAEIVETISSERTRLAGILDNIADGVIMVDREGKILTANKAAITIFGIKSSEIENKPVIEIVHDYEIGELINTCIETNQEQVNQFESDHFKRFLRVLAVPVKGERSFGVLLLIQDLTEVRSLQTMRREMIGNISHDFRTPLAGIKSMVETLRDGAIDDKEYATDFLTRIDDEVDRLTQMVAELTELSRIETGKAELKIESLDMNKLVRGMVDQISPQAERKNIAITVNEDDSVPILQADTERIGQVLINLLHNAVKFTGKGGQITVTIKSENDTVTVSIADNGIGINEDDIPHIFERFYMADRSRSGGGSGMGLAIVRHVIESHNGTIDVTSKEGEGSTFRFRLPAG